MYFVYSSFCHLTSNHECMWCVIEISSRVDHPPLVGKYIGLPSLSADNWADRSVFISVSGGHLVHQHSEREGLLKMIIDSNEEVVMDADDTLTTVFMEKMDILLILMTCISFILAFLVIFSIIM